MSFSSFELLDQSKPIVVFGRDGQVGKALQVCLKDLQVPVVFLGRSDCDLSNASAIRDMLNRYQPQVIINAAAYTAVDKAETEQEIAFAINAKAPQVMAYYIANVAHGILVHYSTDYVFADTKKTAYSEEDITGPVEQLSIYGQSKLAGEQAIEEAFNLAQDSGHTSYKDKFSRYFILRTSWVYGDGGNFIRTMLRLAGERDQLKVVADQIGVPSSAQWLAEVGIQLTGSRVESGIYHAVPDGETSWHGLAVFAIETAALAGEGIEVKPENMQAIPATDYPLPAKRPYNSRLSNQKLKQALSEMAFTGTYPHWQEQVAAYVKEYVTASLKS
ncbi:dTDP-4-dehydrorhamnose reductase [Polynucleobacter sp. MWH-Spelu-300-X4]|uniref:dTDP-4-dehydrorhamnose reductase n=1 Tax=Polynucleobacter sp. MWH-Spelu-300-X4 TaxID=2689109 RepID=UPI001BFE9122|nr:dTDP-4-dehydrorhamnose reductase [Polynucleobacter sp. MWH-Spelu-300-X4]QWD80060.1 dTDP-4-dehydrorhamnose reductase [Polynucleobacter sp. MWH-Spelu-300-X4]